MRTEGYVDEERLLDTDEVAKWLNVTPATVARLANGGALPAIRIGGRFRFQPAAVRDWIRNQAVVEGGGS